MSTEMDTEGRVSGVHHDGWMDGIRCDCTLIYEAQIR